MGGTDWDFDRSEDESQKVVGEIQLRMYGQFLEKYSLQLQEIKDALENNKRDFWDMSIDPASLQLASHEHTTILELINTDNKVLNKVLIVFSTLCAEVKFLVSEAKTKYFDMILFYGEGSEENIEDEVTQLSRFLPHLQELCCFVKRCEEVAAQMIHQLNALYSTSKESTQVMNARDVHFQDVFRHLGSLLVMLVTLDEALYNQTMIHDHWKIYKKTVKSMSHDPTTFGIDKEKLKFFEKLLVNLESRLLTGKIFQRAVEESFTAIKSDVGKNVLLAEELHLYLKISLNTLESKFTEQLDFESAELWVKLSSLYILNFNLFGTSDKRMNKQLLEFSKKIPSVTLYGNVLWYPEHFLVTHLPHMNKLIDKKAQQSAMLTRQNYLQQKSQSLQKNTQTFIFQICFWTIQLESTLQQESLSLKLEDLNQRCDLFLQGVQYASNISQLLKTITNLHVSLAKPIMKTAVIALCKLVELLKGIEHTYHRNYMSISESINHVVQYLTFRILTIVGATKKSLIQDKHYSEKHLDILSSLVLVEKVLNGPGTKERRLIARLALSAANQIRIFREDELSALNSLLYKLDMMCDIQEKLADACNCSFFYWHRIILPAYFSSIYEMKVDLHRLEFMFSALHDCLLAIDRSKHSLSTDVLKECFKNEIFIYFEKQVLKPVCQEVETNLRLHVHSHLQLDDRNPFRGAIFDCSPFLTLKPLRFFNNYINIKAYVEHYLNQTFYNLTTVALHDWKTYGEMRSLARFKYGIVTVEDHLPSQTLEQGLDVLEIMRNINIFVSKYLYNLNNQIFVEQSSNNKHLNTINIRHVANSIRTHGIGIMNTTVNFTYQFLRKEFLIFSQFMFDEHIKSRLMKDFRFFRENKVQLDQKYSYERADKFNKGIRKLGLAADGKSYLDQFRMLISHIGNAMGYVRMIRSGGLHCCSNAIRFIPDLEDIVAFKELCTQDNLSNVSTEAGAQLDHVIDNLVRNFTEGTEYFKLLVDVFAPSFRDSVNMHLRNFYIIVPPLTINFVEHSITCKEKLSKKNKVGAAFTDDGFAMGIAYILNLLDQCEMFDSLHWFQSVQEKCIQDKMRVKKQKSLTSKDDEKLQQAMTLTARRLDLHQQLIIPSQLARPCSKLVGFGPDWSPVSSAPDLVFAGVQPPPCYSDPGVHHLAVRSGLSRKG
uniref:WASH complex subunit 4 n=3 Tax=Timema TaxID=61471 RepID=A0A7R9HZI0_9NEOP|nr:unnamed protein product [Timema bartmani]